MASWWFAGKLDPPIFLLRHPKWVSLGVSEIHMRGRGVCSPKLYNILECALSKVSSVLGLGLL